MQDTGEVTLLLNVVADVIKEALKQTKHNVPSSTLEATQHHTDRTEGPKVSFSCFDSTVKKAENNTEYSAGTSNNLVSIDRATEILASITGNTHIKQEVVFGSNRYVMCVVCIWKVYVVPIRD